VFVHVRGSSLSLVGVQVWDELRKARPSSKALKADDQADLDWYQAAQSPLHALHDISLSPYSFLNYAEKQVCHSRPLGHSLTCIPYLRWLSALRSISSVEQRLAISI
jgi:hypothetical protein